MSPQWKCPEQVKNFGTPFFGCQRRAKNFPTNFSFSSKDPLNPPPQYLVIMYVLYYVCLQELDLSQILYSTFIIAHRTFCAFVNLDSFIQRKVWIYFHGTSQQCLLLNFFGFWVCKKLFSGNKPHKLTKIGPKRCNFRNFQIKTTICLYKSSWILDWHQPRKTFFDYYWHLHMNLVSIVD